MASITNRCLFQGKEPDSWIAVTPEDQGGGRFAYKAAGGYCSARADGSIIFVAAIGPNETFTPSLANTVATAVIGEGPRVIGLAP